ncbi:MAG: hypothetical protein IJW81_02985, partial [Clostridia bacterium]|nr:hypothetical protein [Clostridia bacterium]
MTFEEYKTDLYTTGDASLFGAFPADAFLRFTLKVAADRIGSTPADVSIGLHADEWNHYYGKSLTIPMKEADESEDGVRVFEADVRMADILSEYE